MIPSPQISLVGLQEGEGGLHSLEVGCGGFKNCRNEG